MSKTIQLQVFKFTYEKSLGDVVKVLIKICETLKIQDRKLPDFDLFFLSKFHKYNYFAETKKFKFLNH